MLKNLKNLLADNSGDENVSKMIWVCIVFTVGAMLLLMITSAFENQVKNWFQSVINSWFNEGDGLNGQYIAGSSGTTVPGSSGGGFGGDEVSFGG